MNGKSSAGAILHFELYPPLIISLIYSNNVNTVEWLVSAVRVFFGSALTISFSIATVVDFTHLIVFFYELFQNV